MNVDTLIHAGHAIPVTGGQAYPQGQTSLAIKGNKICWMGRKEDCAHIQAERVINRPNSVMIPGLINAHTHLPMSLFRGLSDDQPLDKWWLEFVLPLEQRLLSRSYIEAGTNLSALECARFGTTTVLDMYFFSDWTATHWDAAGLRGIFTAFFLDSETPEDRALGGTQQERFKSSYARWLGHERIKIAISAHTTNACTEETLQELSELAHSYQSVFHLHLGETVHDKPLSLQKFGKSEIQRLQQAGALNSHLVLAHGVHLTSEEIGALAQAKATVTHNPASNMKLASGFAPVRKMIDAKLNVALGTDGAGSSNNLSMFGAMDLAAKLQKGITADSTALTAKTVFEMATIHGARALDLEKEIGSLEVGKLADVVLVNLTHPHLQPVHNVLSHLVYSATGLEVETTLCNGKIIYDQGKFLTLSETEVFEKAAQEAERMHAYLASL